MQTCPNCGYEADDEQQYCPHCGTLLEEQKAPTTCSVCGASLAEDAAFCGKCGARVIKPAPKEPTRCSNCGAVISSDCAFCTHCGSAVGKTEKNNRSGQKSTKGNFVNKVKRFENKHHVISNVLLIVVSVVVLCVSLLCPVKMEGNALSVADSSSFNMGNTSIKQSIYQVFGAIEYMSLDISNGDDLEKLEEICKEYEDAANQIEAEYEEWLKIKSSGDKYVPQEKRNKKLKSLAEHYMRDVNQFAYVFAITSDGALEKITTMDSAYYALSDSFDSVRVSAFVAWSFALIVALLQIAAAVMSIIFLIIGIIGLVNKRKANSSRYYMPMIIISGLSLVLLNVAPMLIPGGAMLAVALTTALAWFAYTAVKAFVTKSNILAVLKNVVRAALLMIAFFVLCAPILNVTASAKINLVGSSQKLSSSLGATIEIIIMQAIVGSIGGYGVTYTGLSLGNSIFTLLIGTAVVSITLSAFICALNGLHKDAEQTRRADPLVISGIALTLVFAIVPAIISTVNSIPNMMVADVLYYAFGYVGETCVYCSIAFMVATLLFDILLHPNANAKVLAPVAENKPAAEGKATATESAAAETAPAAENPTVA